MFEFNGSKTTVNVGKDKTKTFDFIKTKKKPIKTLLKRNATKDPNIVAEMSSTSR